jgi:Uncharacterized C-terminal domain of topoisomerase IA
MKDQSIETITLEEALKLFDLPRKVGEFENEEVTAAIGRFGPFIRHNNKFVTIPKELNPYTIKLDEAIELIEKKGYRKNNDSSNLSRKNRNFRF